MFFVIGIFLTIFTLIMSLIPIGITIIKKSGLWVTVLYLLFIIVVLNCILKVNPQQKIIIFNNTVTLDYCSYVGFYISLIISGLVFLKNVIKFINSLR
ncbi:MAG: hypothetical protein ACOCP8_04770 [archaeon]